MTHEKNFRTPDQIWRDIHQAIAEGDDKKFIQYHNELTESVEEKLTAKQEAMFNEHVQAIDREIMARRGKNAQTSEEVQYWTEVGQAMASKNPKQALENISVTMPITTIERVMDGVRKHPLIEKLQFIPAGPVNRVVYSKRGKPKAAWGELCDEVVTELTAGFAVAEAALYKLSAFIPVCKQGITFGPAYIEELVRSILTESIANGLEEGAVNGTGKSMPIGMTREVGEDVTIVGGVYPQKTKEAITDFSLVTVGQLISEISQDEDGAGRDVRDLILVCNEQDYYTKIIPATTILTPGGEYRSTLPYNIEIIPVSEGLEPGEAVFGLGYRYICMAGMNPEGNIEYSDHFRFLQDQRVYLVKAFANGFPADNNAFIFLDVSGVKPAVYKVELVQDAAEAEDEGEG